MSDTAKTLEQSGSMVGRISLKSSLACFLAAFIWGTAFVAQKVGADAMAPIVFNTLRSILAFFTLLPLTLYRGHRRREDRKAGKVTAPYSKRDTVIGGIISGLFLFLASYLQQASIATVDIGKAGFLTATYIVLVPLINVVLTRRSSLKIWVSVAIALAGLYFLSISGTYRVERADVQLLVCALFFSLQIMTIDHFSEKADMIEFSCIQFLVVFLIGLVPTIRSLTNEMPALSAGSVVSLLYAGVFSSGIAYTLQAVGQKDADPTIASLILSLESVISAISGFFLLHQVLTHREVLGCVLMAAAIVLVQLPSGRAKPVEETTN
jgi:drug/metabolite transporter (DMT)-like permease